MFMYPILVPCCMALICVYMVGSIKCGSRSTAFNPLYVLLYTILMSSDLSTKKKWLRLRIFPPILILLFLHTLITLYFYLYVVICYLDLCCRSTKRGPYPVKQGLCPFLTWFMNYYGHLQKWNMHPASQSHHELSLPLFTHSIPYIEFGYPKRCLTVLLCVNFPPLCHLQIPACSSTHVSLFFLKFPLAIMPF